jgi:FixJ family two-component response regulator
MMDRPGAWALACSVLAQSLRKAGVTVRQIGSQDYLVYVVDDDVRLREALGELFASHGVPSVTFGSAAEYIAHTKPDLPACLILDLELPDINGLDFQRQLGDGYHPPIVFITGHGDIPSSVRAIKDGAVDFLVKPFSQQDLMAAIETAIARDRHARLERAERARLQQRYSSLTPRESQVLPLIVSGLLNKQAAAELGISEVTLQIHRSRIMLKMAADSFADLVRIAGQLKIAIERPKRQ